AAVVRSDDVHAGCVVVWAKSPSAIRSHFRARPAKAISLIPSPSPGGRREPEGFFARVFSLPFSLREKGLGDEGQTLRRRRCSRITLGHLESPARAPPPFS